MTQNPVKRVARDAEDSVVVRALARAGYAVLGLLHVMVGAIAISVAVGFRRSEADPSGAMLQLSRSPSGVLALWLIAGALLALAGYQCVQAVLMPSRQPEKRWAKRVVDLGKAVAYGALAVTAIVFGAGGHKSQSGSTQSLSGSLIAAPGGVFVLVAVGLVTIGIAIGFAVAGIRRSFDRDLRLRNEALHDSVVVLGCVGYLAKAVALAIVGVLFVIAAITLDPKKAGGLDAAYKSLMQLPYGQLLLWAAGVGLIAYGLFCFVRAALERL